MLAAHNNPFRAQRIDALPFRAPDVTLPQLLQRFAAQQYRGVLLGPHGSGKTTLREQLQAALLAQGPWHQEVFMGHQGEPFPFAQLLAAARGAGRHTLLCIDGLDLLRPWQWWQLRRAAAGAGGILATSHRRGRLPLLYRHRTSPALLAELVQELLQSNTSPGVPSESESELSPGLPPDMLSRILPRCPELYHRHRGNIRDCLRELYDELSRG